MNIRSVWIMLEENHSMVNEDVWTQSVWMGEYDGREELKITMEGKVGVNRSAVVDALVALASQVAAQAGIPFPSVQHIKDISEIANG